MTVDQLEQLIEGNVEIPQNTMLVLAKKHIATHTKEGVYLGDRYVQEASKQKDPMYIIASATGKYPPGTLVRVGSFMETNPPIPSALEGYDIVLCREHDIFTVIKETI